MFKYKILSFFFSFKGKFFLVKMLVKLHSFSFTFLVATLPILKSEVPSCPEEILLTELCSKY